MSIQIRNIVPEFQQFWNVAFDKPAPEQEQKWQQLYEGPNADIFSIYYSRWGDRNKLYAAFQQYDALLPKITACATGIEERIEHIAMQCAEKFEAVNPNLQVVIMVGLSASNGWATTLNGIDTFFLAVERFQEQAQVEILIAHECAHALHANVNAYEWNNKAIGQALCQEGLAILTSVLSCPHKTLSEYLWFRLGEDSWIANCQAHWQQLRYRLSIDLERTDSDCYEIYFLNGERWKSDPAIPRRAGYFAAYQIFVSLLHDYSIAEMSRWSPNHATAAIRSVLVG